MSRTFPDPDAGRVTQSNIAGRLAPQAGRPEDNHRVHNLVHGLDGFTRAQKAAEPASRARCQSAWRAAATRRRARLIRVRLRRTAPSSDGDRRARERVGDAIERRTPSHAAGALQSGQVAAPPPPRRGARVQRMAAPEYRRPVPERASKQTQQSVRGAAAAAAGASPRRGRVGRSRRVATSTADAVALAHTENRRVADGQERRDAGHRRGLERPRRAGRRPAAPTLKARRTLGERPRAARARRGPSAPSSDGARRLLHRRPGAARSTPSAQLRRARAASVCPEPTAATASGFATRFQLRLATSGARASEAAKANLTASSAAAQSSLATLTSARPADARMTV